MTKLVSLASRLLDRVAYTLDCGLSILPGTVSAAEQWAHLVTVYFHGVLPDPVDGFVDPQEGMTPDFLRQFIKVMVARGYTFVSPDVLLGPDRPEGNLVILSSDDGYRSVQRLLPLLEEESASLTIFVTTEYARSNAIYWWDQVFIAGHSSRRIRALLKRRVRGRAERDRALRQLGIDPNATAFHDSHRLLSPEEIERFAANRRLTFGNHTRNHLSLPLLDDSLFQDEVEGAKRDLETWTGKRVRHFAFPYGDHDERTLDLLHHLGYSTAFTTKSGQFSLSLLAVNGMHVLPRYHLRADRSVKWQARIMFSGITAGSRLEMWLRRWIRKLHDGLGDGNVLAPILATDRGDETARSKPPRHGLDRLP